MEPRTLSRPILHCGGAGGSPALSFQLHCPFVLWEPHNATRPYWDTLLLLTPSLLLGQPSTPPVSILLTYSRCLLNLFPPMWKRISLWRYFHGIRRALWDGFYHDVPEMTVIYIYLIFMPSVSFLRTGSASDLSTSLMDLYPKAVLKVCS